MGRGKSKSVYNTPYSEQENHAVDNRVYMTKQHELTVGMREEKEKNDGATEKTDAYNKHSSKFYTKYFRDSSNNIRVTRIASTVKGTQAVKKFFTLVNKYETDNNILLSELSKEELMFRMLDRIEKTGTVLELADDIRQFLTYRFKLPDELRLYLYKAFYPRIFDFNENKEFHSEYIRENFDSIYRQIEELLEILVYDTVISAISDTCAEIFKSMKRFGISVLLSDTYEVSADYIAQQINAEKNNDSRLSVLEHFIPSILFFTKHHNYVYRTRDIEEKKAITLLTSDTFYKGQRADESRMGILVAIDYFKKALKAQQNFSRLLNIHYVNKRSHVLDFAIKEKNCEFPPYLIDGILTKKHISDIIDENAVLINSGADAAGLQLTSVYNSPNCVTENLNSRDYEIINFIIARASKSIRSYYLGESVTPAQLCEIIQWLNDESNAKVLGNKITSLDVHDISKSDYDEIMEFELKNLIL